MSKIQVTDSRACKLVSSVANGLVRKCIGSRKVENFELPSVESLVAPFSPIDDTRNPGVTAGRERVDRRRQTFNYSVRSVKVSPRGSER